MTYSPYEIIGEARKGPFLIICDHATAHIPPDMGDTLGLPDADMSRHIAYDIGALGVSKALGEALDAPVIQSNFSRLVIDPNRAKDDPTLLMRLYDGSIIPANRHADETEKERRLAAYYHPYHEALKELAARRDDTVLVSVHSFTPKLKGRAKRPWHIGILHAWDTRLCDPLIDLLEAQPDLTVGRNEPYHGHLPGDTIDRHALHHGRHNALIELRNDLIGTAQAQESWGKRLAPLLQQALSRIS